MTTEPKWTPGPWRVASCDQKPVDGDDGRRFLDVMHGEEFRSYCDTYVSGFIDCGGGSVCSVQHGQREANANLIAAAPSLYEALERLASLRHYFATCGDDADKCARCGSNFRSDVHYRAHESGETDLEAANAALRLARGESKL